jgi:hypothetical protein
MLLVVGDRCGQPPEFARLSTTASSTSASSRAVQVHVPGNGYATNIQARSFEAENGMNPPVTKLARLLSSC